MIQTPLATVAGQSYLLSFAYSPRPGRPASDNGIDVLFDGALLVSLATSGIGLADTSWTVHSFVVTATGATSSLEFRAVSASTSFGGYLDAVSVVVPEPSALLLLANGLATATAYRRRRAR
jgi:PEP-CTERM motif